MYGLSQKFKLLFNIRIVINLIFHLNFLKKDLVIKKSGKNHLGKVNINLLQISKTKMNYQKTSDIREIL